MNKPTPKTVTAKAQLKREESTGGDTFYGTAEALVAAGIVKAGWIPGAPGQNKYTVTVISGQCMKKSTATHKPHDENWISIARVGKNRFKVMRGISREDSARRSEIRGSAWWVLKPQGAKVIQLHAPGNQERTGLLNPVLRAPQSDVQKESAKILAFPALLELD